MEKIVRSELEKSFVSGGTKGNSSTATVTGNGTAIAVVINGGSITLPGGSGTSIGNGI